MKLRPCQSMSGQSPPRGPTRGSRWRKALSRCLRGGAGSQDGFTLLEAMVGVTVTAVIVSVMASGITQAFRAVYFQRTGAVSVDEGRRVIPIITRDLQVATESPSAISLGPGNDLTIAQQQPDPNETGGGPVIYSLAGSDLVRTQDGTSRTVARHVLGAVFAVSGPVTTVTLTTQSESNTRSAATNTWEVYRRIEP